MSGPIPKRDAERRRRNKPEIETIRVNLDEVLSGDIEIPAPPTRFDGCGDKCGLDCEKHSNEWISEWHPVAEQAYLSLAKSGQVIFYEPSDWATAYALCESLSRELKPKPVVVDHGEDGTAVEWVISPVNGAVINAFLKGWSSLMATEGERRRLKIELDRKKRQEEILSGGNVVSITQSREEALA